MKRDIRFLFCDERRVHFSEVVDGSLGHVQRVSLPAAYHADELRTALMDAQVALAMGEASDELGERITNLLELTRKDDVCTSKSYPFRTSSAFATR